MNGCTVIAGLGIACHIRWNYWIGSSAAKVVSSQSA